MTNLGDDAVGRTKYILRRPTSADILRKTFFPLFPGHRRSRTRTHSNRSNHRTAPRNGGHTGENRDQSTAEGQAVHRLAGSTRASRSKGNDTSKLHKAAQPSYFAVSPHALPPAATTSPCAKGCTSGRPTVFSITNTGSTSPAPAVSSRAADRESTTKSNRCTSRPVLASQHTTG
jgi:hypothetical protein